MNWLNRVSKFSVLILIPGLVLLLFGLTSGSLFLIVHPGFQKGMIAAGILLTASGIYMDVKHGWLAQINNNRSPLTSYLESAVIGFVVGLTSMMVPLFLGLGSLLIPLFLFLVFPFSLLGASIGYFTKRQRWVWVTSVIMVILVLMFAFLAFYVLALIGQNNA